MSGHRYILLGLAMLLAAAAYLPSLQNDFLSDEQLLLGGRELLYQSPQGLVKLLTTPYWWGTGDAGARYDLYRPLIGATWWLDHQISGRSPWAYHLSNLLAHLGVVLLVYLVLSRVAASSMALAVAALVATGPVAMASVGWTAGRPDVWATLFGLVFICFFDRALSGGSRWHLAAAAMSLFFALAAKEVAIIFPFVAYLLQRCRREGKGSSLSAKAVAQHYAVLLIPIALFFAARWAATGSPGLQGGAGSAAVVSGELPRLAEQVLRSGFRAVVPLHFDFFAELLWSDPGQRNAMFVVGWILLLAVLTLIVVGVVKRQLWAAGGAWFVLVLLPVYPLGHAWAPLSDFYMYAGLPGIWLFTLDGLHSLGARFGLRRLTEGRLPAALIAAVAVVFAVMTFARMPVLKTPRSLLEHGVKRNPKSVRAAMRLGEEFMNLGQDSAGVYWMMKAVELQPDYLRPWMSCARHFLNAGDPQAAGRFVDTLFVRGRDNAEAQGLIARYYYEMGHCDWAVETFRHALRLSPPTSPMLFDFGRALICVGENRAAAELFGSLVDNVPSWSEAYAQLGLALENCDDLPAAIRSYRTAAKLAPRYTDAWERLALSCAKAGDVKGANEAVQAFLGLNPPAERVERLREQLIAPR